MTHDQRPDTDPLDALFATARQAPMAPSDDFMARALDTALGAQPLPRTLAPAPVPKRGLWLRMLGALGGGFGLAGLGSAAMAGLLIGYVQPDPLLILTDSLSGTTITESYDLSPGFDAILTEDTRP